MKVIYIAGPFRGHNAWIVEQNIRQAEELAFRVAELGAMPLCPHTNTRFFDRTLTDQFWIDGTMELMHRCDAVVFTRRWKLSAGAKGEHSKAVNKGLPVFYEHDLGALRVWLGCQHCGGGPLVFGQVASDSGGYVCTKCKRLNGSY